MPLSPQDAAVLRQALAECDSAEGLTDRQAYRILAKAIENLLAPASTGAEFAAHLVRDWRLADEEGPAF